MINETQLLATLGEDTRAIFNNQKIVRENLVKKWKKTRLLEKLDYDRQLNMSQLLENEAAALYGMLQESSLNSAVAGFAKIAFPLVRRVFANLIADKIVAVQPMSLPVGLLFYLDFQYDANTAKPPYTAGGSLYGNLSFGGNTALEGLGSQLATGGFYGLNASYGYRKFASGPTLSASTYYDNGVAANSPVTATWVNSYVGEDGKTYTAQRYEFNFGPNITSVDLANLRQFVVVPSSTIAIDNGTPYNGFNGVLSAANAYPIMVGETALSGAAINPVTQTLTSGKIVVWSTSGSLIGTSDTLTAGQMLFIAATSLDNRAEFEAVGNIPEIDLSIKKVQVGTQTRKLKTKWTPELAQDINAYQGIDAELELTKILSEQIITDIDRELISDIITGAHFRDVWSRKIGKYVTLNASNQVVTNTTNSDILGFGNGSNGAGPVFRGNQKEWYQTLIEKINKMSYKIFQVVLRGKANFIVTSATVAGMLETTEDYRIEIESNSTTGKVGVVRAGTLQNRYSVYVDPYLPDAIILVGYKGEGFLDAGFVYAPYVPLVAVPTLFDPENFTPRKGILSRYGKQMVRPDYYGVIYALDLDLF